MRSPVVRREAERPQSPLTGTIWTSDASTFYQLNAKCQDFITRYLGQSLITPDDPDMVEVNRKLLRLAFTVRLGVLHTRHEMGPELALTHA